MKLGKVKQTEIKNQTYYYYDIINIEEFDPNLLKIDKKHYKGIDIYYMGYIAIKKLVTVKYLQRKSFGSENW